MADAIPLPFEPEEAWRPVVGWEDVYEVSDHGRVRRIGAAAGTLPGRLLQPMPSRGGYYRVALTRSGRRLKPSVHRLVAEAFIGPPPAGHECNHKDGDKANNRLSNLEWMTRSDNMKHSFKLGLHPVVYNSVKLTAEQVAEIRRLAGHEPKVATAARFGISDTQVGEIQRGTAWVGANLSWLEQQGRCGG